MLKAKGMKIKNDEYAKNINENIWKGINNQTQRAQSYE